MIDIEGRLDIVGLLPASAAEKLLVVASDGRGFAVRTADVIAETRKGKTVVTPRKGATLALVKPIAPAHDYVAAIGANRKLLGPEERREGKRCGRTVKSRGSPKH